MRSILRRPSAGLVWFAITLWPAGAWAVPEFPHAIRSHLMLDYVPPCSVCHVKDKIGIGTAQTPFALSMRQHGLQAERGGGIALALDALANDDIDSDGDGTTDTDELIEGTDPNTPAPVSLRGAGDPQWGCSAVPPARGALGWPAMGLLAFGLTLLLRRRARVCRAAARPHWL